VIPDNTEIGEGTNGVASYYHVTKSGVTLVTPEMLQG